MCTPHPLYGCGPSAIVVALRDRFSLCAYCAMLFCERDASSLPFVAAHLN
jgi:hypothetical protein